MTLLDQHVPVPAAVSGLPTTSASVAAFRLTGTNGTIRTG